MEGGRGGDLGFNPCLKSLQEEWQFQQRRRIFQRRLVDDPLRGGGGGGGGGGGDGNLR